MAGRETGPRRAQTYRTDDERKTRRAPDPGTTGDARSGRRAQKASQSGLDVHWSFGGPGRDYRGDGGLLVGQEEDRSLNQGN